MTEPAISTIDVRHCRRHRPPVLAPLLVAVLLGLGSGVAPAAAVASVAAAATQPESSWRRPDTHRLLGRDLALTPVVFVGIDDGIVRYREAGILRERSIDDLLGMFRIHGRTESTRGYGLVVLVDDQQVVGNVPAGGRPSADGRVEGDSDAEAPADGGDVWRWENDFTGRFDWSLDRIRSVRLDRAPRTDAAGAGVAGGSDPLAPADGGAAPGTPLTLRPADGEPLGPDADIVTLVNGDRIAGFVAALDEDGAEIEPLDGPAGESIFVPLDRLRSVRLLNPREPSTGMRLLGLDGSVLEVTTLEIGEDFAWFTRHDRARSRIVAEYVRAVVFDADAFRALGDLAVVEHDGPGLYGPPPLPRRLDPRSPFGLGDVRLRGPVTFAVDVLGPGSLRDAAPRGGRFAARAIVPSAARTWADLDLVLRTDDGTEIARHHLDAAQPTVDLDLGFPPTRTLVIELEEAARGPVHDVVVLEQPRLRLDPVEE